MGGLEVLAYVIFGALNIGAHDAAKARVDGQADKGEGDFFEEGFDRWHSLAAAEGVEVPFNFGDIDLGLAVGMHVLQVAGDSLGPECDLVEVAAQRAEPGVYDEPEAAEEVGAQERGRL
jgi:hypothetical protein